VLIDSFDRTLDYLRVSITDRCNLRCCYCMPLQGVEWKPHETMLTFEEILRLSRIMAALGICKIRITGGEPLVRRGTASFLKNLKTTPGIERVTLTTNGFLLETYLDEAETIGVLPDGVNISLDALDPQRYRRITRQDAEPIKILPLMDRLLKMNILVKINCVPVRSFNDEEILPIAALARERNIVVRFIELMPLGSAAALKPVSGGDVAALIEKTYGILVPFADVQGGGPAVYYSLPGFSGKIGFINAISHGFCGTCNRLRLTSEGFLKLCLSTNMGLDLREPLRAGASDEELARAIKEAAVKKPRFHTLSGIYGAVTGKHTEGMSEIGG
jgi:cyclic pyranopterin phosphate synthase